MRFPFSLSELGFFNARLLPPDIKASLVIRVQPFQRVELVERASKIIRLSSGRTALPSSSE
jgi:hypothetical protein